MKIAITGGIAEGKTTVLRLLQDLGYQTASSDEFARACFWEKTIQEGLAALLGSSVPVEPERLRAALTSSDRVRRAVKRLMHPFIVSSISQSSAHFVEVPLLIEACLQPLFDQVWVVTCGPDEQLLRLKRRVGPTQAADLIDLQLRTFAKTPFGDVIVRTNTDLETVKRFVRHEAKRTFLS